MAFNQVYANRFLANLNGDADITFHGAVALSDDIKLMTNGDVNCCTMDFTPLFEGSKYSLQPYICTTTHNAYLSTLSFRDCNSSPYSVLMLYRGGIRC